MRELGVEGAQVETSDSSRLRSIKIIRPVRESRWRKRVRDRDVNKHGFTIGTRPIVIELDSVQVKSRHWSLPVADASVDEIVVENVLEYVRDDRAFYAELRRIARPGALVRARVPNAGPLAGLDSLNLYKYLTDITKRGLRVPETDEIAFRRHLSLRELSEALGPDFEIERSWTTSLSIAELINLAALVACGWLTESPPRYQKVRPIIDLLSRAEARIKPGRIGFWLHVDARKKGG